MGVAARCAESLSPPSLLSHFLRQHKADRARHRAQRGQDVHRIPGGRGGAAVGRGCERKRCGRATLLLCALPGGGWGLGRPGRRGTEWATNRGRPWVEWGGGQGCGPPGRGCRGRPHAGRGEQRRRRHFVGARGGAPVRKCDGCGGVRWGCWVHDAGMHDVGGVVSRAEGGGEAGPARGGSRACVTATPPRGPPPFSLPLSPAHFLSPARARLPLTVPPPSPCHSRSAPPPAGPR